MKFTRTSIDDVIICEPIIYKDERGYFAETFRADELEKFLGYNINFCQDNESKSCKGVLRGLHFQLPPCAQTKLVRVMQGEVLDVAVDIRKRSPTFGKHVAVKLNSKNKKQLLVPRGFAHGFLVLEDDTVFNYKVDNYYSVHNDRGILFNDQKLDIDWQIKHSQLILSSKDLNQPKLHNAEELFEYGVDYYE